MPWPALSLKDLVCKRLDRFLAYPYEHLGPEVAPRLVIVGPYGKYIEPWGDRFIGKYGLSAKPPTRRSFSRLYTNKLRELKLEMLLGLKHSSQRKRWEQGSTLRACWSENHTL